MRAPTAAVSTSSLAQPQVRLLLGLRCISIADGCCSFVSGGGRIDVGRIVVGINPQASYIFAALVYRYAASGEILSESLEMLLMLLRRGYRDNDEIAFSTYGVSAVGHIGNDADQFVQTVELRDIRIVLFVDVNADQTAVGDQLRTVPLAECSAYRNGRETRF